MGSIAMAGIGGMLNVDKDVYVTPEKKVLLDSFAVRQGYPDGMPKYHIDTIECGAETCNTLEINIPRIINNKWTPKPYWENCSVYVLQEDCTPSEENDCKTEECKTWVKIYFSDEVLEQQKDDWEQEALKGPASREEINLKKEAVANEEREVKVAGGKRTVKEKAVPKEI